MAGGPQSDILQALKEISEDPEDHLCASFTISNQEEPWVQVVDDFLNLYWPFQEDPMERVQQLPMELLPGMDLNEAELGVFATFTFDTDNPELLAAYIDGLFEHLYNQGPKYKLDTEVYPVGDEEIPDFIPITREEDGPTHYLGSHEGGLFAGFVVGVYDEPRESKPTLTWLAVLHLFNEEGEHQKTRFEVVGTSKEDEDQLIERAENRLVDWVEKLEDVDFGDIAIQQFSTTVDGREFGLMDTTWEDEDTGEIIAEVRLIPNDLVFTPPWDGSWIQ